MADGPSPVGQKRASFASDKTDAELADDKLKAEYEARKQTAACEEHPFVCSDAPKDKTRDGTSYSDLKLRPAPPKRDTAAEREALSREAAALEERLRKNPERYVGKDADAARLAEIRGTLNRTTTFGLRAPTTTAADRKGPSDEIFEGRVGADGLSVHAEFAAAHLTHVDDVDVLDASAQVGLSTDVSVTAIRWSNSDQGATVTAQGPSARFHSGFGKNDDGSVGVHSGAEANVASASYSRKYSDGGSVAVGVSEGIGAGASVGWRDVPGAGGAACVSVSALFFSVGACIPVRP